MVVKMNNRGNLTIPASIRRRFPENTVFEVEVAPDGAIVLQPRLLVDPSDAWFWSAEWQAGEAAAQGDIDANRVTVHETGEDFLESL
jgi:hypothetical protein